MADRYDHLTSELVASARRAADRLDEDRSKQAAADAAHAIRTLANMVEEQHKAIVVAMQVTQRQGKARDE
jgi:hypothetical protein